MIFCSVVIIKNVVARNISIQAFHKIVKITKSILGRESKITVPEICVSVFLACTYFVCIASSVCTITFSQFLSYLNCSLMCRIAIKFSMLAAYNVNFLV